MPIRVESRESLRTPETLVELWTEIRPTRVAPRTSDRIGIIEATDDELAEQVSQIIRERRLQRVW